MTTLAPTIYTRTFPRTVGWLRDLILILLGALFIAALAQVEIPLPFTPVPITGQTFGVLLVGAALGSKRGGISLASYLAFGLFGLPFFAGGAHGLNILIQRDGWLFDRVHHRSLRDWFLGRKRLGKKRAHIHYSLLCWNGYYLCVRNRLVNYCTGKP